MSRDVEKAGIDLFHGLSHELPFGLEKRGIPTVGSMHDLIFRHYPDQYPWFDRQMYGLKFRSACRRATQVVAISQHTARDLQAAYGLAETQVKVIYQSCHPQFFAAREQEADEVIFKKYGLPAEFGLYVGSVIPRKNLLGVVQALALLPAGQRPPLVVVGAGKAYLQQVRQVVVEKGLVGSVFFPEKVAFDELPSLYRRARFFVYPSFYEGFGIPIIEALACGTPVIAAHTSSLPEAGGPDSRYVDPAKPEALAQAIQEVNEDHALSSHMRQRGQAYVQRFRGEAIAGQWMGLYRELVGGG
jgi:glycosyltransferase involved in cell wall biosynthesis